MDHGPGGKCLNLKAEILINHHEIRQIHKKREQKWARDDFRLVRRGDPIADCPSALPEAWAGPASELRVRFVRRCRRLFRISEVHQQASAANEVHPGADTYQPSDQSVNAPPSVPCEVPCDVHNAQHTNDPKCQRELLFCFHSLTFLFLVSVVTSLPGAEFAGQARRGEFQS